MVANGGHLVLTSNWGKSLVRLIGFVKRRVSTTTKITVANFEEVKAQLLLDIKVSVEMDEIPTLPYHQPRSDRYSLCACWILGNGEGRGTTVEIVAADDKRRLQLFLQGFYVVTFCPHRSFTKV